MKRIRTISFALVVVLLVLAAASVLSALPHSAKADTGMVVSSRNPAILADVGEIITLGDYSVEFGSTVADAGAITWKKDGSPVTSICPDKKGVTPLTARSGGSEKTVYLIAKQPDETDYVLYENDFSGTKADLDSEGWVFLPETTATVSDGQLHLGTRSQGYARAILPAFIGDFSGYGIEAVATQTDCTDTARWCSLVYHIQNANGQYYPYYHMCVRNNTTSNTIEFAERTTGNQWNVITTISKSMNMKDPHTLKIACYDNVVQYFFDGESVFYTANAGAHDTGYAGLTCNYGTMNVDTLRVTLLLDKPEKPIEKPQLVDTSGNRPASNITNYVSNHAYITSMADAVATFRGSTLPVAVLFNPGDRDVSTTDVRTVLSGCVSFNVIPEFQLSKTSEIDLLVSAMDKAGTPEAVVVGPADVVKYARTKSKTKIRGILDLTSLESVSSIYDLYTQAAGAYAQGVLLPAHLATKKNVAELQEYELSVWAFQENPSTDTELAWLLTSGANAVVSKNWKGINRAQVELIQATNALTRTPVWTAHRGNFVTAPENSMSAYRSALEEGADCIETDVHLTKDGEVLICHDDTIDRTSNGTGYIKNMTLEQIQQYKLKKTNGSLSDETFPTFRQLLELCKGKDIKILCELKSGEATLSQKTAALIKEFKMEKQVVYISFNANQLLNAKKYMDVTTGYLLGAPEGKDPDDTVGILNSYFQQQTNCLSYHSTMAINYGNIGAEFLRDANDRGVTLWTWTYSTSTATAVCNNFLTGMNGMTTNNISYLKNTVKTLLPNQNRVHLKSGGSTSITINAITYLQKKLDVTKDGKLTVQILDNDGVISYSNGKITALKDGTASIMFSYETNLPNGRKYTLYTQPVPVFVNVDDPYIEYKRGDINGDGKVNSTDYLLLKRIILGMTPTDDQKSRADVDGNGLLNSKDYILLKRYVLGTYQFE